MLLLLRVGRVHPYKVVDLRRPTSLQSLGGREQTRIVGTSATDSHPNRSNAPKCPTCCERLAWPIERKSLADQGTEHRAADRPNSTASFAPHQTRSKSLPNHVPNPTRFLFKPAEKRFPSKRLCVLLWYKGHTSCTNDTPPCLCSTRSQPTVSQ